MGGSWERRNRLYRIFRLLRCGIIVSLLTIGFLLVDCSPGNGGQEEVESEVEEVVEGPIDMIEVNETEFSLDSADIALNQPGTYVLRAVNFGVVHALETEGAGIEEETENVQPGESTELEVNLDLGTYELYCPVGDHEERGMVGTVTVEEG